MLQNMGRISLISCASIVLCCVMNIMAQMNGNILSEFLRDCYSDPRLLNRNNLPSMSWNVMLDIIRKIEDHPDSLGDMRQISTALIHLFRQDGIVYDPTASGTQYIVPYSPTGFPAYKNRLLLTKLISRNQFNLPTNSITSEEKCALHLMVSSSLLVHARGDEEWTCNRISIQGASSARMSQYTKNDDIELFDVNGVRDKLQRQIVGVSNCPIETGVVSTPWGDVSMGPVIAGIASGLEEQNVLVSDLVTVRSGFSNNTIVVNNRYASTISGDIAETAIRQGMTRTTIRTGATGGWNSTSGRRHYFQTRSTDLELTDAEIRGGLDGVILSELASSYVNKFSEFKLSQLIDMYYSTNGILHEMRFRACNRKVLVPDVASTQILTDRSLGTAIALYHVSQLTGTTNMRGIESFINNTVAAFNSYIPQNINDPVCSINNEVILRPKINLILITEPTVARSDIISYIVDNIEVSKFGSSITLLHPNTGETIIEKTFSTANFYQEFAKVTTIQTGLLNVVKVLESLGILAANELAAENSQHYCGGNATVALFISDTIPLIGDERVQAVQHANWLRINAPDLRLVFASTAGHEMTVASMLRSASDFIPITITDETQSLSTFSNIIEFLKTTPRRIVNPLCGNTWTNIDSGTIGFDDFVDANGINLYRLIPNYFFDENPSRVLRVHSADYGPISVCYSRSNTFPRRNQTSGTVPGDVVCESATNEGMVEINLMGACTGATSIESCPPLYFTVSSTAVPLTPQCKDFGCRYPNDVKFLIAAHELGCFNNSFILKQNITFILLGVLLCFIVNLSPINHF